MPEDAAHRHARRCLGFLGLTVIDVQPKEGEQRADFLATIARETYVVEVKGPGEDPSFARKLHAQGHAEIIRPAGRTNTASRKIKEANDQLLATPAPEDAFRVVALVSDGHSEELQTMQYVSTLYGKELLYYLSNNELTGPFDCYYFSFSEFYRHRSLDAALLFSPDGSRLCPNTFSNRCQAFLSSHLYQFHLEHSAVEDPREAETRGKAFILDADIDRRNEAPLLEYIAAKYLLPSVPFVIHLKQATGQVLVPREPPNTTE